MPGTVVKVWLEGAWATEGKPTPFQLVETDFDDFASFLAACEADDLICGEQLLTKWSRQERDVRVIHERKVIAFRGSAVRRAELPNCRIVDQHAAE